MGDSAYSFSLTTFSRTGKLLQIEYALNAVANGRTALGIAAVDGVVIATDKKFASALVQGEDVSKVEAITDSSGFVYAGVGPDYRVLGELLVLPCLIILECHFMIGHGGALCDVMAGLHPCLRVNQRGATACTMWRHV